MQKKNAKTRRVKFSDEDIWDENSAKEIIKQIEQIRAVKSGAINFPISIFTVVKDDAINGISRGVFMSAYRLAIQPYLQYSKETLIKQFFT